MLHKIRISLSINFYGQFSLLCYSSCVLKCQFVGLWKVLCRCAAQIHDNNPNMSFCFLWCCIYVLDKNNNSNNNNRGFKNDKLTMKIHSPIMNTNNGELWCVQVLVLLLRKTLWILQVKTTRYHAPCSSLQPRYSTWMFLSKIF